MPKSPIVGSTSGTLAEHHEPTTFLNSGLKDISGCRTDDDLVTAFLAQRATNENTRRAYQRAIDVLRFWYQGQPLRSLSMFEAAQYMAHLNRRMKPSSAAFYISVAKALFNFGRNPGYFFGNPFAKQKIEKAQKPRRRIDPDDVAAVIRHAPSLRYRVLFEFLYESGARLAEALSLRWEAVHESHGFGVVSFVGKGKKRRDVTLRKEYSKRFLAGRGDAKDGDLVFPGDICGKSLSDTAVRQALLRSAANAGIGKAISPHWLRHAHGSHALDKGAPIQEVRDTLGHENITTTDTYAHAKAGRSSTRYLPNLKLGDGE